MLLTSRVKNFFVLIFGCMAFLFASCPTLHAAVTKVTVKNTTAGTLGIFDPSLAQGTTRRQVWMSYTAVDPSVKWPSQNKLVESIRLASSSDGGLTWVDVGKPISAFNDVTVSGNSAGTAGTWVNEVSQLVYDPGAPAAERYKVLWQHYLVVNGQLQFQNNWLAMKMADTPEHLPAAPEMKVFSSFAYDSSASSMKSGLHPPADGTPFVSLDRAAPALNTCIFTEPGMVATSTALYLSVACSHMSNGDKMVVLMKCGSPCHPTNANSWAYVSTLFNKSNAPKGDDGGLGAPGLFQGNDGAYYITVTPVKTSGAPWPDYYQGCLIYKFTDFAHGVIGKTPVKTVSGLSRSFNGACAYNVSNWVGGMLYGQLDIRDTAHFQIYASGVNF